MPQAHQKRPGPNGARHRDALPPSDGRFAICLRIKTWIVDAGAADALERTLGKGPGEVPFELMEAEFLERWPQNRMQMVALVKKRRPR